MANLLHILQQFGLDSRQSSVYLAALELGEATIHELAQKSNQKRTHIYNITDSLIDQGLITEVPGRVKRFIAENPEQLKTILTEKQKLIDQFLPNFQSIFNLSPQKPKVKFYQGVQGFKTIIDNLLKNLGQTKPSEYQIFTPTEELINILNKHTPHFIPSRIKLGIQAKIITTHNLLAIKRKQTIDQQELRHRKFLPKNFDFKTVVFIYPNHIILLSLEKDILGVEIENIQISNTFKTFFDFMWLHIQEINQIT